MQRELNVNETVYTLCTKYPELVAVLQGLGFTDIVKPGMLQTAGRFMTLKKGCCHEKHRHGPYPHSARS